MTTFIERYRALWKNQAQTELPLGIDRQPLFSPAAAAQEKANGSKMWRRWANTWLPWQFGDWIDEAMAVHNTAFIGDWSPLSKVEIVGPGAVDFLQYVGVADLSKFGVGRLRHFVCVNEQGKVAIEGVLARLADDSYFYTGGGGEWLVHHAGQGSWDISVQLVTPDYFMFELQGPRSLDIVTAACEQPVAELAFNHWMPNRISGIDVRVLRTGVSGELGYEIHGDAEHGSAIWKFLEDHGTPLGLVPLGARSQVLAHVEAGIATVGFDYIPATLGSAVKSQTSVIGPGQSTVGTYRVSALSDLFRSPFELNWCSPKVVERREFIGSDALRAELKAGGPRQRLFGLIWNVDDVMGVYRSLFEDSPIQFQMDLPRHYAAEYFSVLDNGTLCGAASSRIYSPKLRRVISLTVLDVDVAQPGKQVSVLWGDSPERYVPIRAEIVALPFKPDRRRENGGVS